MNNVSAGGTSNSATGGQEMPIIVKPFTINPPNLPPANLNIQNTPASAMNPVS